MTTDSVIHESIFRFFALDFVFTQPGSKADILEGALKNAGRDVPMIVYPPYPGDGHQLFSTVGSYWNDVIAFLKRRLT